MDDIDIKRLKDKICSGCSSLGCASCHYMALLESMRETSASVSDKLLTWMTGIRKGVLEDYKAGDIAEAQKKIRKYRTALVLIKEMQLVDDKEYSLYATFVDAPLQRKIYAQYKKLTLPPPKNKI
jgi:hypothetical protein